MEKEFARTEEPERDSKDGSGGQKPTKINFYRQIFEESIPNPES